MRIFEYLPRGFAPRSLLVIVLAFGVQTSNAEVIYDSFGPGGQISDFPSWAANGLGMFGDFPSRSSGAGFTAPGDYRFDWVEIPLTSLNGLNSIDVFLAEDFVFTPAGHWEPGLILDAITVVDPLLPASTPLTPVTIRAVSTTRPFLRAGERYWVIATTSDPSANALWYQNRFGFRGDFATTWFLNSSRWSVQPNSLAQVFRVEATEVPEPSTLVLFGAGFLVLVVRGRTASRTP